MKHVLSYTNIVLFAVALSVLTGCDDQRVTSGTADTPPVPEAPPTVVLAGHSYRVSGPYTHDNLSVFLFHTDDQDKREFITLDEGLKSGEVKVTEKASEQVNELLIENTSAKHLFLHEGDRVRGGKQDRTIFSSLVIAPKTSPQPLPSFCIEHNRWTVQSTGRNFQATGNSALAPKNVRTAAKVNKDQSQVWSQVAASKQEASANFAAPNTNSSLNETLDSPKIKAISDACAKALAPDVEKPSDAVGIAIAINGKIEEVNIYPNHGVLSKISPRLLESYAIQAAQEKKEGPKIGALTAKAVLAFITEGAEKSKREEKINAGNGLNVQNFDNKKAQCATVYENKVVHWQALSNVEAAPVDNASHQQTIRRTLNINPAPQIQQREIQPNAPTQQPAR